MSLNLNVSVTRTPHPSRAKVLLGACTLALLTLLGCVNPLVEPSLGTTDAISRGVPGSFGPTSPQAGDALTFTFTQDIDPTTLTASTVTLTNTTTGEVLEVSISYAARVLTLAPIFRKYLNTAADLSSGSEWNGILWKGPRPATTYILSLKPGIKTTAGTAASLPAAWTYTTADLDFGLYFFGANGAYQKYQAGVPNQFYSASKKTYLYFHGWQANTVLENYRKENIFWINTKYAPNTDSYPLLAAKGYNVAAYFWDQFADEAEVQDAEAKVWMGANNRTGKDGTVVNMRYLRGDGTFGYYSTGKSVADLASDTIKAALAGNSSGYIHIAGHSLGNQLATRVASSLATAGMPVKRMAILDPFWSKNAKSYIGNQWPGAACRTLIDTLVGQKGMVFEVFKSSALGGTIGDENVDMRKRGSFARIWPDFIGIADQAHQHVYAYVWYHQSFGKAVAGSNNGTIGASASDTVVKSMMNYGKTSTYFWYTSSGQNTTTLQDDYFTRKSGVSTW